MSSSFPSPVPNSTFDASVAVSQNVRGFAIPSNGNTVSYELDSLLPHDAKPNNSAPIRSVRLILRLFGNVFTELPQIRDEDDRCTKYLSKERKPNTPNQRPCSRYIFVIDTTKIILFYTFAPIGDPDAIRLWQRSLCEGLGLKGRIIISRHGINGTVGGPRAAVEKYVRTTCEYEAFKNIDFKWSDGDTEDFPRLVIRIRDEIVTFGISDEIQVDENGIIGGGTHLSPAQVHELIQERGEEVVFFDGRNAYEAAIGKFKNAVVPDVETTPGFVAELETGKYDHLKDKPIIAYCTGGVRCEVLSMVMKNRGFKEVYQIKGGVVRYGEQFKDSGLWEGSLYIFDKRMNMEFSHGAKTIGVCEPCESPASKYYNCTNRNCRKMTLACNECVKENERVTCSKCVPANA